MQDPVEGFADYANSPSIDGDAVRWVVKRAFYNLKKIFKEQNNDTALQTKKVRDHKNRMWSTKKAVSVTFCA